MVASSVYLTAAILLVDASGPDDRDVRAVVERSLPFIEREGQRWIDDKKCVTCHQVPFMVWSLNVAADRGFAVDAIKLKNWNAWATDWRNMANKRQLEEGEAPTLSAQPDTVAQLLLGRRQIGISRDSASRQSLFATRLAEGQQSDGSWKAGGQLPSQRRPAHETNAVTTMWALLALQSVPFNSDGIQGRIDKAEAWLEGATETESTEVLAVRLLLASNSPDPARAEHARAALLEKQQPDGGWGWLTSDPSDAFGSGVALYAMNRAGLSASTPSIARARQYLVQSQRPNGSWAVNGTKRGKADHEETTATYWGTCWAVIGLVETLPATAAE